MSLFAYEYVLGAFADSMGVVDKRDDAILWRIVVMPVSLYVLDLICDLCSKIENRA